MLLFDNPVVWLWRIRKRKGYGVHSPFAFHLITEVLEEHDAYYAYQELDAGLRWYERFRYRRYLHMLFRLTNYVQPQRVVGVKISSQEHEATSRVHSEYVQSPSRVPKNSNNLAILDVRDWESAGNDVKRCELVVFRDIHKCKDIWHRIVEDERFTVTFDLYDVGLAFTRRDLNKQNYVVNW